MKILFLDIDGVLNSTRWYKSLSKEKNGLLPVEDMSVLDPDAISLLNSLGNIKDLQIVMSSSWRRDVSAIGNLKRQGFKLPFHSNWRTNPDTVNRPEEILNWLLQNGVPLKNCVILDDATPGEFLESRWAQTEYDDGLTQDTIKKIRELLNDQW